MDRLNGYPSDPRKVAERREALDSEIQKMLAARNNANKAAFNARLAAIAAELNAAAAKREEQPAHLRNRTRKQSAVLKQLMADAEAEAEREGKTIYYNNNNDRAPNLNAITSRYNIRLAQAAEAKAAANLEGKRKQEFYDRLSERFQTPKMPWKNYEDKYGSYLYNKYKFTMGGALLKTMSALRKSQKICKTRKTRKTHKTHKTCRH